MEKFSIPKPSLATWLIIAIGLGIVFAIIGADTNTSQLADIGVLIITVGLLCGALLLKEEEAYVRLGMLIAGGLVLSNAGGLLLAI